MVFDHVRFPVVSALIGSSAIDRRPEQRQQPQRQHNGYSHRDLRRRTTAAGRPQTTTAVTRRRGGGDHRVLCADSREPVDAAVARQA